MSAALPLAAYKKIYKIEEEIREHDPPLTHVQVLAVRVEKIKPVFDELVAWCRAHQPAMLPSSKLGTAIRYMLNHHVALGRFLTDGAIPIDNGPAERLHVRCAIARKNFLFAGSDDGGERAAIAFTILGSCRLLGIVTHQRRRDDAGPRLVQDDERCERSWTRGTRARA